ncbi:hypothetical protein [Sorangium sp. So ce426]|uniref:hypothetical protein n=1 Tax=Sorangium sp. So ce426 TaxID=3133312 RepID=UPI003F5CB356
MSPAAERTLAAWSAEALRLLARVARARGLDGLRRINALNKLLNVIGGPDEVEEALAEVGAAPSDVEIDVLTRQALELLKEYPKLKARAQAGKPQISRPLAMPVAETPPAPPPVEPSPPLFFPPGTRPVPYPQAQTLSLLADPLFVREVTLPQGPTPRDLSSPDATAQIHKRQEASIASFFAPSPASERKPEASAWTASLELDDDLYVVTTALVGLPQFVKTLDLVTGERRVTVLASNLRSGTCRTRVRPSTEKYAWSAGAFDEDLGEELKALELPGLQASRASAFRLDAAGAGQLLVGAVLSPGRSYRLVIPPELPVEGFAAVDVPATPAPWRRVEITLPTPVPTELAARLVRMGLAVAQTALDVSFAGIAAREYRLGRGGERYACFRPEDAPIVRVAGVETKEPGALVLFLAGPHGQTRFPLPPGNDHLVELGPLVPGRYALDVLSLDKTREPERLFFEVDEQAGRTPGIAGARVSLELDGESIAVEGAVSLDLDLGHLDASRLRIHAPPLWRIGARWEGARSRILPPLFANGRGEVPAEDLLAAIQAERETERIGDLHLDFGDLGAVTLRHTQRLSPEHLREKLRALLAERGSAVAEEPDLSLLRTIWIDPVCSVLGYQVREIAPMLDDAGGARGFAVFALEATVREDERITVERPAALILGRRGVDLVSTARDTARDLASRLGRRDGFVRAILTDGLSWALWERGRAFAAAPLALRDAVEDGTGALFEAFLSRFHA